MGDIRAGGQQVQGVSPSGTADSSLQIVNPVKIGGKGVSGIPTAVTTGQIVDGWYDLVGRQMVGIKDSAGNEVSGTTSGTTPTSGLLIMGDSSGTSKAIAVTGGGIVKTIINDGTNSSTIRSLTGAKSLDVSIVDGTGTQITSFGGGTQYTASPVVAAGSVISTLHSGYDGANVRPVSIDTSGRLLVNLGSAAAAQGGYLPQTTPYMSLRVTPDMTTTFYDPFDAAIDTVNRWTTATTGSGTTPSVATGTLSVTIGANASSSSSIFSIPTFVGQSPSFCQHSFVIKLEAVYITNGYRFWGLASTPVTPTPSAPLTDAVGFEVDSTGKMWAVVYAAGVRTTILSGTGDGSLTSTGSNKAPVDNAFHRYICLMRTDKSYWFIDNFDVPVATSNNQSPNVQTLPARLMSCSAVSVPTAACAIICNGVAVGDTGRNATQLADGTYPWRKAAISSTGAITVQGIAGGTAQPVTFADTIPSTIAVSTTGGQTAITTSGGGSLSFVLTGTATSSTFQVEGTVDGTNWVAVQFHQFLPAASGIGQMGGALMSSTFATANAPATYTASSSGFKQMRLNFTAGVALAVTITSLVQQDTFSIRQPAAAAPATFAFTTLNQTQAMIAAPSAGYSIYVTGMHGSNSGAANTLIEFRDNVTARYDLFMALGGGGFSINLAQPWKLSPGVALNVNNSVATTSAYVTINYYIAP